MDKKGSSSSSNDGDTATMRHMRRIYVEKFLQGTVENLGGSGGSSVQESFGELKGQIDGQSFNILMTLLKEKVAALEPYAQGEFEDLCQKLGLNDKFREAETLKAAAAAASLPTASGAAPAAAGGGGKKKSTGKQPAKTYQTQGESSSSMAPEDLARHRRMVIKRKELAELQGMQDREAELFQEAEENLKAAKEKMRLVYHDMSSLAPEAQKLLQICTEN